MVPDAHPIATPAKTNRKSPSLSFLVAETINKKVTQAIAKPTL
jgi:hypothetical protein